MATLFVSGFGGTSGGASPGIHKMADRLPEKLKRKLAPVKKLTWADQEAACYFIEGAIGSKRNQPIVLVGHSFGGDSVVEIADLLKTKGICVDLMIQIDSVGAFDDEKPSNVEKGVNLWNASREGIDGEAHVEGSENIPISGTTHTGIDDPDDKGKVDNDSDSEHEGKNAFQLVQDFAENLSKPFYNQRIAEEKKAAQMAPHKEKVLKAVRKAGGKGIHIADIETKTAIRVSELVPAFKQLTRESLIRPISGERHLQYFIAAEAAPDTEAQ